MMKKLFFIVKYFLVFVFIALNIFACNEIEETSKPNIVFILTDQWRASATGYAGDPNVLTPNLDKFAETAVNFVNAVSVAPVCTPYRASLLTGRYPTSTGMFLNDIYLPEEELCMAEIFKAEGYKTGYIGKWHLDGHGRLNNVEPERRQGFDYWKALECSHNYNKMPYYANDDPEMKIWEGYSPYALSKDANKYLSKMTDNEEPFLLFISFGTPHFPHGSAPRQIKETYPLDELILAPNVPQELEERTRKELQGYYGHCTATDSAIGNVLNRLRELKLMENTIVVFTSDHGEMMGSHGVRPFTKQLSWDESIKVPFLISYPSIGKKQGSVVNAPINTPDILPSLLGLANIDIPQTIEGDDLSELIQHPDPEVDRAALIMNVSPFGGNFRDSEYRAIRTGQYTYERTPGGPSKLLDNLKDPYQMNNLVGNPEFSVLQEEMDQTLNQELEKVGDEFYARDYYMRKWSFEMDNERNAIDYWSFAKGKGRVQTPALNNNQYE